MEWYLKVLKKYSVFSGRAHRKEYWMFILFNVIVGFCLGILEGLLGLASNGDQGVLGLIYNLAVFIPGLAVGVRRMHDIDRSGWWILFPIVNLVFAIKKGTVGPNKFGPDPKTNEQ